MITTSPLPTRCDSPPPMSWPPSAEVDFAALVCDGLPGVTNVAEPLMMTTTPVQSSCERSTPSSDLPRLFEWIAQVFPWRSLREYKSLLAVEASACAND